MKITAVLVALLSMVVLAGCTVTQKAGDLADRICNTTEERRQMIAAEVQKATAPHRIILNCYEEDYEVVEDSTEVEDTADEEG